MRKCSDKKDNNHQCRFACIFPFYNIGVSFQGDASAVSSTVSAGGNGSSWDKFIPQNLTINAGENVTWINPMQVGEPHTVTFIKDKEMFPPLVAPFSVPNNTEFIPAIPSPNVEPTT